MNRFEGLSKPSLLASGVLLVLGSIAQLVRLADRPSDAVRSPLSQISAVALLAGGMLLLLALVALYVRRASQIKGFGFAAALVAGAGTVLMCAVYWNRAFMEPAAALVAPALLDGRTVPGSLLFGTIVAKAIFGIGWIMVGVAMVRARVYGLAPALLIMLGGALNAAPLIGVGPLVLGVGVIWLAFSPAYARLTRYRRAEREGGTQAADQASPATTAKA
ncbi:hypothetical protein [Glaciibacter superstes]|uniref:hypothetical protein n=1 Tax=Glaciibacter superstes TaxID=501023 RepID=UPI0003B57F28|nr:hypothetical protein [Glaciibacter superstes]